MKKFLNFLRRCYLAYRNPFPPNLEDLEKENIKLKEMVLDQIGKDETIQFIIDNLHQPFMVLEGGVCRVIAELLVKQFIDIGAINYVEMTFTSKSTMPGEHFVLTLQKSSGLTPHQKVTRLEKELAEERSWKNWS